MTTFRVDFAYDGTRFHGYAAQPDVRTVQGVLESALFHHTGRVDTAVSGRTDKGVHAAAQVLSFSSDHAIDEDRVVRSLNRQLAPEVVVSSIREAPEGFHARFSATGRGYVYVILNREIPDPFLASFSWHNETPMDVGLMNQAAGEFIGEQDFAALCRSSDGGSTFREVRTALWKREGDLLLFSVTASAFCHQMVRSMVALCVDVGRGKVAAETVPVILGSRDRSRARGVSPPHGLTLVRVEFGDVMEPAGSPPDEWTIPGSHHLDAGGFQR